MSSAIETIEEKIKSLWQEIFVSGKDEFATENKLRLAQINEHQRAIKELMKC